MLILTRRAGEALRNGDDISIDVLGITGNQVRLGFTAPNGVTVHRREVYDRIRPESDTRRSPRR